VLPLQCDEPKELPGYNGRLQSIDQDMVKAKEKFEATMQSMWEQYQQTYQR
jgi:hypothetical protein